MEDNKNSLSDEDNIEWTEYHENIFIDWSDKAMCYRYLHTTCNRHYSSLQTWFTIPVIFISTLTGVANFAQERIPDDYKFYYTMGVGGFNIIAGFITTVSQFLKVSELNEGHRVSAIAWGKFCRNIKVELSKSREERVKINVYLKSVKEEYDLLLETSPTIRHKAILEFNKKFKKGNFFKPEICDGLISVSETMYKHVDNIVDPDMEAINKIKEKRKSAIQDIEIEKFVRDYKTHNQREPTIEEIYENLEDSINKVYIDKFVNRLNKKISDSSNSSSPV